MPHALSMPPTGFQAVILCGPGVSFDTFTSKAELSPKALIPIANRPMVWYALDFCYRTGITSEWYSIFFWRSFAHIASTIALVSDLRDACNVRSDLQPLSIAKKLILMSGCGKAWAKH